MHVSAIHKNFTIKTFDLPRIWTSHTPLMIKTHYKMFLNDFQVINDKINLIFFIGTTSNSPVSTPIRVNIFEIIKSVSNVFFDMTITAYHDKPLILIGATFRERSVKKRRKHGGSGGDGPSCSHENCEFFDFPIVLP